MGEHIDVTTYFLEMHAPPGGSPPPCPSGTRVLRASSLSAEDYRALYDAVGARWLWHERSQLEESELARLIHAPEISIFLLQKDGVTAGYTELERTPDNQVQILYFGLLKPFIGAGLGRFFLDWTVRHAFASSIDRLWVHTCSLDHPRALATYEAAGFVQYKKESGKVRIPRAATERRRLAQADDGA